MIQDLQHIVTLYLDPDSYKTLNLYKPKKYNKLLKVKESYKNVIPYLLRNYILSSSSDTKLSIIWEYDNALRQNKDTIYVVRNCNIMIQNWIRNTLYYLKSQYIKTDKEILQGFGTCVNETELSLSYIEKQKPYTLLFAGKAEYFDSDVANELGIVPLLYKIKKCVVDKNYGSIKDILDSAVDASTQMHLFKNVIYENLHRIKIIFELQIVVGFLDRTFWKFWNENIHPEIPEHYTKMLIVDKYFNLRMFKFEPYDPEILPYQNNVKDIEIDNTAMQCIYDIMCTADQLLRVNVMYSKRCC